MRAWQRLKTSFNSFITAGNEQAAGWDGEHRTSGLPQAEALVSVVVWALSMVTLCTFKEQLSVFNFHL